LKRLISTAAVATLAALSLTACSSSNAIVFNSHVTLAEIGTIATLNPDAQSASTNKIASDLAQLTSQRFFEIDKNDELVANKNFGTVAVTKQSPFTVAYTFGKSAVWSDGSKLDATDAALAVLAAKSIDFNSNHFGSSLSRATVVGSPKPGASSITLQFDQPIADWKTALEISVPAHVVGKAAGIGGNVAAVRAGVLSAISDSKPDVLASLATAYSSAFAPTAGLDNFVTDGAYTISAVSADELLLKAVRDYAGLHSGVAETVDIRIYSDNASALKAVGAGKADIVAPQPNLNEPQADLVAQAQDLSAKKVSVLAPQSAQSEQFVINLEQGNLADSSYKDPKIAQTLRQAFMNIVPKTRAIDFASMTQTVASSDSLVYSHGSKNYSAVIASNGSSNFAFQDSEKSSELIASLKLKGRATARVLFDSDNPAAVAEWTFLSDHAATSGFTLTNISSSDPSEKLSTGAYDVYLGPLPLIGVGSGSVQQLMSGPAHMPEATFTSLTKDVLGASDKNLSATLQTLDQKLFELGYGLPMYQLPTLLVRSNRIQGFEPDPFGSNSTWGYWTWHVSADK
jgi:peptide/nickel transport system substrate-binding protein